MKTIIQKLVFALLVLTVVSCEQQKIGYVDNIKLMDEYQEKIDIEAKFKTKADALGKKRDSITQAYQIEAQAFQLKAQKMSQTKAQEEYAAMQQKGQLIGRVTGLDGSVLEELHSPIDGVVHELLVRRVVFQGDLLYNLVQFKK